MSRTRTRRLAVPLGLALLVLAGCADQPVASLGAPSAPPATRATPTPTATATTSAGPVAPLTGLPASAAVARRPAVVVAVPLTGGVGLDKADVVFQEYETATTLRAVAVFQSRDAEAGPVGEVRSVDPALLPILRPLYAMAGGGTGVRELLTKAAVVQVVEYGTTSTAAVLAAAPAGARPPPPIFPYAARGDALATTLVRPAHTLAVTAPDSAPETWAYSAAARRWTRSGTAGVAVANLVVQSVQYKAVTLKDPIRTVRSARVLNRGSCYVFSADKYAACNWYKKSGAALTNYTDRSGIPVRFAPGPTWVVLLPVGGQVAVK